MFKIPVMNSLTSNVCLYILLQFSIFLCQGPEDNMNFQRKLSIFQFVESFSEIECKRFGRNFSQSLCSVIIYLFYLIPQNSTGPSTISCVSHFVIKEEYGDTLAFSISSIISIMTVLLPLLLQTIVLKKRRIELTL